MKSLLSKTKSFQLMILLLLIALTNISAAADFKIFDGTLGYLNGPIFKNPRVKKLEVIYENVLFVHQSTEENKDNLFPQNDPSKEDEKLIRDLAKKWKKDGIDLICLDIERWPGKGDDALVSKTLKNFKKVFRWIHQEAPNLKIGVYGLPPVREIDGALNGPGSNSFLVWKNNNKRLQPLAKLVDVIFPSLYTIMIDPDKWKAYAIANLEQAKLYNKPVYAFIWPRYHDSIPNLSWTYLPHTFWEIEVNTVKEHADGVVFWDYQKSQPWNDKADWIQTVKTILNI